MEKDIDSVLITEEEIAKEVEKVAEQINTDFHGKELLLVVILKGSIVFAVDLMRRIKLPSMIDFIRVSSYGNSAVSSGDVCIKSDLSIDIKGKNVIIVEDIIDSGNTLYALKNLLLKREPKDLKICTLLDKPQRREANIKADYIGIQIPDEFVVGYGLDYAEHFRGLPYIGVLSRKVYMN